MECDCVDDVRMFSGPLDVAAAVAAVTCAEAGGIDVFIGTTRAEEIAARDGSGGKEQLLALDYEAYEPMAVAEMKKIVVAARGKWPVLRCVVWHRVGKVMVGEASVVIAVSCGHRGEAFEACRFVIDELKKTVPIWKKDVYTRGEKWQME